MSGKKKDYRAVLEKKLCLARDTPEPIFDISDCDLKHVPPGVYSLCKVFRKEVLLLQDNKITNLEATGKLEDLELLKILDASNNWLAIIPASIGCLTNLQVLQLDNNNIVELPDEIGELKVLERLTLSRNALKSLPSSIGGLVKLQHLDLRRNPKLKQLPINLCLIPRLEVLLENHREWITPPPDIVAEGSKEVMEHLRSLLGNDVSSKTESGGSETPSTSTQAPSLQYLRLLNDYINDRINKLEKDKESKSLEQLKAQQAILEQQEKELKLQNENRSDKKKLLEEIMDQQCKIDDKLTEFQKQRIKEQEKFASHLKIVQESADQVIRQLIEANKKSHIGDMTFDLLAVSESELLMNECSNKQRVLDSMKSFLKQQWYLMERVRENEVIKKDMIQGIYERELELNKAISNVLSKKQEEQERLLESIADEIELQYGAVAALLEKADSRSVALKMELDIVENQLSTLTAIELKNKRLRLNEHVNDLAEKRVVLANLLMDLHNQQQERRKQLIDRLVEMELQQPDEMKKSEYWLAQYERLLNNHHALMAESYRINPKLSYHMALMGVVHCLPFLKACDTKTDESLFKIDEGTLKEAGVSSEEERQLVLTAIRNYLKEDDRMASCIPSAPPLDSLPSAPPLEEVEIAELRVRVENECVVCWETMAIIIFVPCGHLCCCVKCADYSTQCPMCRADITHKLYAFTET